MRTHTLCKDLVVCAFAITVGLLLPVQLMAGPKEKVSNSPPANEQTSGPRWADDGPEWIAKLRQSMREATCGTGLEMDHWRLELWDLRESLKGCPKAAAVYIQQIRLFSSLPILLEEKAFNPQSLETKGRAKYREACIELVKRAGMAADVGQMEADVAKGMEKIDWQAVAKRKKAEEENPHSDDKPPIYAVVERLVQELDEAVKGHPHPEQVWMHQIEMVRGSYYFQWTSTPMQWYVGACMEKLATLGRRESLPVFEKCIWFPQAAKAWFAIQWPRMKIEEKKRAVVEGLGYVRVVYDTRDAVGEIVPARSIYFSDPDHPLDRVMLDRDVLKPLILELGRAIRPEIQLLLARAGGAQHDENMLPEVKWFAELVKRPEFAPTPREMDAILAAQDAEGRGTPILGKSVLALNLIGSDDDQRFSQTVNEDDGLWGVKEYEAHVRKVYGRAAPEMKTRMRKNLSIMCFGEQSWFYDQAGRIEADIRHFNGEHLHILHSLNDPEFLKQLHQLKSDVEAAAADTKRWQAGKNPWEKADPEGPARLRRFIQEKLDPAIKELESGKPAPAEKPTIAP